MIRKPPPWYRIFYECPECDVEWEDEWDCACDSECPVCGQVFEALWWEEMVPDSPAPNPRAQRAEGENTMCEETRASVYTVVAIERPTLLESQGGKVARQIIKVDVVANGRSSAIAMAARQIKDDKWEPQRTDWQVQRFKGDNA